jgi:hypothetical protein
MIKAAPQHQNGALKEWGELVASHSTALPLFLVWTLQWKMGMSVIARSGDWCVPGSWVIATDHNISILSNFTYRSILMPYRTIVSLVDDSR